MTVETQNALGQRNTGIEGRIAIAINTAAGKVDTVSITSTRPLGASAVLENRGVMDAICSLRLLYSLCGAAHTVAGLTAAEKAMGITADPAARAARQMLVAGESLGQLLWRLLLDLPQTAGEVTAFDALRDARARLARLAKALYPRSDWVRLGGEGAVLNVKKLAAFADTMDEITGLGLFGEESDVAAILTDPGHFATWMAEAKTPIAGVLRTITERGLMGFGASRIPPMPRIDSRTLAARLAADDGRDFAAAPDVDGTIFETGALARHRSHPLIAALITDHGTGLLVQIAAKLVDVVALIEEFRAAPDCVDDIGADAVGDVVTSGSGLAMVETARGRLIHYVEIDAGKTARYRILAPTEWNFHAQGPLADGLTGSIYDDKVALRDAVTLLVTAIDPCVQFDIELN